MNTLNGLIPCIISGGSGTRLWPVSRQIAWGRLAASARLMKNAILRGVMGMNSRPLVDEAGNLARWRGDNCQGKGSWFAGVVSIGLQSAKSAFYCIIIR